MLKFKKLDTVFSKSVQLCNEFIHFLSYCNTAGLVKVVKNSAKARLCLTLQEMQA